MTETFHTGTVTDAAERRRSIRHYASDPVPRADLQAILRVATLAPSAFNLQPWRFVVVEDAARRQALAKAAFGQPQVAGAPAVIVQILALIAIGRGLEEGRPHHRLPLERVVRFL